MLNTVNTQSRLSNTIFPEGPQNSHEWWLGSCHSWYIGRQQTPAAALCPLGHCHGSLLQSGFWAQTVLLPLVCWRFPGPKWFETLHFGPNWTHERRKQYIGQYQIWTALTNLTGFTFGIQRMRSIGLWCQTFVYLYKEMMAGSNTEFGEG